MESDFDDVDDAVPLELVSCLDLDVDTTQLRLARNRVGSPMENDEQTYNMDENGVATLHCAARDNDCDAMETLVDAGGNVNELDKHKRTPLHWAAENGGLAAVEWLINYGIADIDATDINGLTAVHYAARNGHVDVLQKLIDTGANANILDNDKRSPLHSAVKNGKEEAVKCLVDHGNVDVEACDYYGESVLKIAVRNDRGDIVKLLVDKGVNVEGSSNWSGRPAYIACLGGHANALEQLLAAGCLLEGTGGKNLLERATYGKNARCIQMVKDEQKRRYKDEYQLFHLNSFTIACRKYKIFKFASTAKIFQKNVLPLNRPIFFCHFAIPPNCFPSPLTVLPIVSQQLRYPEYLVVNTDVKFETVQSMVNNLRNWNVESSREQSSDGVTDNYNIFLQIQSPDISTDWNTHFPVGFHHEDMNLLVGTTYALLQKRDKGEYIKNIFIDFLKCLYSVEIEMTLSGHSMNDDASAIQLLKKFTGVRKTLMMFYDENNRKLPNMLSLSRIKLPSRTETTAYLRISVIRKCAQNIIFIPQLPLENVDQTIRTYVREDTLFVKGMTESCPTFVILQGQNETVADIKKKINAVISNEGRLEMVSDLGLISDDTRIVDVGDVFHYVIIEPFILDKIQKREIIGSGGFGKVWSCSISGDDRYFAVKKIKMQFKDAMTMENDIFSDVLAASRIDSHPRIVKYVGFYETDKRFYIRMDLMKESLSSYIKRNNPLTEMRIRDFSRQILQGLDYLHDNKIIHRDIKGTNVLLDEFDDAKLTDYGIYRCFYVTSNWIPPEVMDGPYDYKCDIWSVGATMVEMITGTPPFDGYPTPAIIVTLAKEKKIPFEYPGFLTSSIKGIVNSCLNENPIDRPDCKKLLLDEYFR